MNKLNHKINRWAAHCLLCLLPFTLTAMDNPPPPDEAMVVTYQVIDDQTVQVDFKLIEKVYLYKHAFAFSGEDLTVDQQALFIPVGKHKDDPSFGAVEVYYNSLSIQVPVADFGDQPKLKVKYQGCIEDFICYPPQRKTFDLSGQLVKSSQTNTSQSSQSNSNFNGSVLNTGANSGSGFFGSDQQLLPVDQAFQFETIALDANQLMVRFSMAPNIYLYKDQIQFITFTDGIELGQPEFPPAQIKDDPEFGLVDVFYDVAEIVIPIKRTQAGVMSLDIEAAFQGCEDGKVCYPPTAQLVSVDLPPANTIVAPSSVPSNIVTSAELSEQGIITQSIADDSIGWTVLKFFGFGLLLSLTPCVFPMIPILSGLIVGQKDPSTAKAFTLSLIYVLAMALTYTVVGVVAGLAGTNLQALFQTPWVIISFSLVFVLLALSMFGFYDLQLPASWQNKLSNISNKQKSGSWLGVAIMGLLSALIVGPCVAPPLAAAVIYISSVDGGPVVGGLALFAMSMGMGIPLIAIGTSAGKWMPGSGGWMNVVKSFFGVLLIGMAIWFLSRIMAEDTILMMWGLLMIATAVMWHQNAKNNGLSGWVMSLFDALKVILLVIGVAQLLGGMAGQSDPLRPLKGIFAGAGGSVVEEKVQFTKIKSLADLNTQIASSNRPVFLDFYADWCIECKRMEKTTFMDVDIVEMTKQMTVLKADVTANDAVDAELMKHFGIVGPPASLFFAADGQPMVAHNFFGYKSATDLKRTFEKVLN